MGNTTFCSISEPWNRGVGTTNICVTVTLNFQIFPNAFTLVTFAVGSRLRIARIAECDAVPPPINRYCVDSGISGRGTSRNTKHRIRSQDA